jgi:hypothetical protein
MKANENMSTPLQGLTGNSPIVPTEFVSLPRVSLSARREDEV